MLNYANELVDFKGCPGCANHAFSLPCGMAYENDKFTLSQDWELPIPGFFIVSPKRCVEKFEELETNERIEMFEIVNKTIKILRKNNICDRFDVIFEEKEKRHLHVWILPRYKWMSNIYENIIGHIDEIFKYAKSNFRTEKTYKEIKRITEILNKEF